MKIDTNVLLASLCDAEKDLLEQFTQETCLKRKLILFGRISGLSQARMRILVEIRRAEVQEAAK